MRVSRFPLQRLLLAALTATALAAPTQAAAAPEVGADFDGDGYDDLAVGAPLDSVSGHDNAGAVNVIYGSGRGALSPRGDQQFTQDTPGVKATASGDDLFGDALGAGDLDGDGYDDLAIGVPGEDVGGVIDAGAVHVLYGSADGLSAADDDLFHQNSAGVNGRTGQFDRFGAALAVGRFAGGRAAWLAVGAPGDTVAGRSDAGAVNVLRGGSGGVTADRDQLWTRAARGVPGDPVAGEQFGAALAAGDLSGNGPEELAIGAPGRTALQPEGPIPHGGFVVVLYGTRGGLSTRAAQNWSQNAPGVKGLVGVGDGFGDALAIADFDGDGAGDLAVGAPFDTVGGRTGAGAVNVLFGSTAGLRASRDELWTQNARGVAGGAETDDLFGAALAAADFSRNGIDDLAIGVPREDVGGHRDAGMVHVLYGRGSGLRPIRDVWHQGSPGIHGWLESGDQLGSSLTAGDFDDDGDADLAAGAPFEATREFIAAGAVNVIYGSNTGISRADELFTQATPGIKGAIGQDLFGAAVR